jgi:hypothetical protein
MTVDYPPDEVVRAVAASEALRHAGIDVTYAPNLEVRPGVAVHRLRYPDGDHARASVILRSRGLGAS